VIIYPQYPCYPVWIVPFCEPDDGDSPDVPDGGGVTTNSADLDITGITSFEADFDGI
jgi:hypothetical protein